MENEDTDEKKEEEVDKPTTDDSGKGDKPKKPTIFDETDKRIKRMAEENDRAEAANQHKEEILARERMFGNAEAGQVPTPKKKLTDAEYAEAYEKGEVDPFKEDGYV